MPKITLAGLRSTTAHDLLNRPFQPRKMLLDPWLRTEESCIIWAASGVGKTMLSLSLALAIAGGGKLGDWNAETPCKVLYVDGEMHLQDIKDRLVTLSGPNQGILYRSQIPTALRNLIILARQDQELEAPFYDLTDEETHRELIARVKKEGVDLVILDNFTTLSEGLEDENASAAFKKVQGFFLQLKRLGVASLLVHHANKSGREMRGSTALETTFEVIIGLTKPTIARMGEARFVAEFSKFRGKGDVRLQKREWTLTETGWNVAEDLPDDPKLDPVYLALKSLRYTSANQIGNELGMHRSTVLRRIERLVILGVLKKDEQHEFFSKARDLAKSNADNGWDEHYPDVSATALVDETF